MATNIEQQEQLNNLMREFIKLTEEANKSLKGMFANSKDIATAFEKVEPKNAAETFKEVGEAISEVAEKMEETGNVSQEAMDKVEEAVDGSLGKFTKFHQQLLKLPPLLKAFAVAGSALHGFLGGLRMSVGALGDFMGAAQGIIGALGQIAISVLTFPFKVLEGILGMGGGGGGGGLAEALNEVRKEFGSLKKDAGGAIRYMAKHMRGELAETGLRVRRVFGNLAERLKFMLEYAKNVGPVFDLLRDSFARNAEAVGAYYKGLGLLEEGQRGLAERAQAMGEPVTEQLRQVANFSLRMGETFGLTAKLISREMGEMARDFQHFGHLSVKELAQTVVYARKLGLEVKALGGIMDKYLNFEDAAEGAAQLSQAFGLNVDALSLIKAQNPAEQVDMIRKAFFAAGNSIERMNRQERKLLATQTGLEEANLDLVFSAKNQAFSYDQVKKSGDAAAKSQMSQEEAMRKLRDSIERLVKGGGGTTFKGFIDAFIKGFAKGIRMTMEFRRFLRGLKRSVWQTFYAGREVGRSFVKLFPGVSDFFKGLRGIFDPRKFKILRRGVVQVFKEFFKDLDFKKFMEGIKRVFFNYFDLTKSSGKQVLDAIKRFTKAIVTIFTQVLREAIQGATKIVRFLVDLISGKADLSSIASAGGGIGEWIWTNVVSPIYTMLQVEAPALGAALWSFLQVAFEKVKEFVMANLGWIALVFFGPAVFKALLQGLTVSIGGALFSSMEAIFVRGAGGFLSKAASIFIAGFTRKFGVDVAGRLPGAMAPHLRGVADTIAAGGGAGQAATQAVAAARPSYGLVKNIAILGAVMVALAGTLGLVALAFKSAGLTIDDFKTTAVAVGLAAGLMLAISASMAILSASGGVLSGTGGSAAAAIATGLIAVGVVGTALAFGMKAAVEQLGKLDREGILNATLALGAATALAVGLSGAVVALTVAGLAVAGPQIAATIVGLAAVGGLAYALGRVVKPAVDEFGGLDTGAVMKTAIIMGAMGVFVGGLAGLMAALAASGAVILTGVGAVAIGAALGMMYLLFEGMKSELTNLIGIVNSLPMDRAFVKKLEVFSTLMESLGSVATVMGSVLSATSFSIGDAMMLLMGTDPIAARIQMLSSFMGEMKSAISNLVNQVKGIVAGAGEEALKKAEPIISVLSGVAGLATALAGPAEMLKNTAPLGGVLYNDVPSKIAQMQMFIQGLSTPVRGLVREVARDLIPVLTEAGRTLSPDQLKVFQGFGQILNAVGGLIRSFTATALVGVISRSVDGDPRKVAAGLENYGRAVKAVTDALTTRGGFFKSVATLALGLTRVAGSLDPGQIKSAQAVAPILSSMFGFLTSIMTLMGNLPVANLDPSQLKNLNLEPFVKAVRDMLTSFQTTAVELLQKSVAVTSAITPSQAKNMKGAFQALGSFFEALKGIPELLNSLKGVVGEGGTVAQQGARLKAYMQTLVDPGGGGLFATLGTMVTQMQAQLGAIPDTRDLNSKVQAATNVLNTVKLMGEVLKTFGGEEGQPAQLTTAVSEQVKNAVSAMIRSVNEVSEQLRGITVPNLKANLRALGGTLGIGASDRFTITNRHFNININLEVIMRSDEIEQALVNSKSKVLRATP